jgi:hypothetical protein
MVDAPHLHTAARSFCITQHAYWIAKYDQVKPGAENYLTIGWTYSQEQYSIFPRYRLAEAILINLERFEPDADTSLVDALHVAQEASESAFSALCAELASLDNRAIALNALREQLDGYSSFLLEAARQQSLEVDPLPYGRVLSRAGSDELWQVRGAGYRWFPLSDEPAPKGALTFHQELWEARRAKNGYGSFWRRSTLKGAFCYAN